MGRIQNDSKVIAYSLSHHLPVFNQDSGYRNWKAFVCLLFCFGELNSKAPQISNYVLLSIWKYDNRTKTWSSIQESQKLHLKSPTLHVTQTKHTELISAFCGIQLFSWPFLGPVNVFLPLVPPMFSKPQSLWPSDGFSWYIIWKNNLSLKLAVINARNAFLRKADLSFLLFNCLQEFQLSF